MTITGDLVIYADSHPEQTTVTASKLKTIKGGITIQNIDSTSTVQKLSISFPSLESVGRGYAITGSIKEVAIVHSDNLKVGKLFQAWGTDVEEFHVGGLVTMDGQLTINTNPSMEALDVGDLVTVTSFLRIEQNDVLSSVSLNALQTVGADLTVNGNPKLVNLVLPALQFAETLAFASDGQKFSVSLPQLSTLGHSNTTSTSNIQDVHAIDLSSLRNVTGDLSFQSTSLTDLTIPILRHADGSITVEDNAAMITLALPRLHLMQNIFIDDNNKLKNFTANALATAGTISITGSALTNVELFGLKEVTSDLKIEGAASMDCSWFDQNIKSIVKGSYSCVGNHTQPATERKPSTGGIENTDGEAPSSNPTTETSKSAGGGLPRGAKAGIGIAVAAGVLILASLVFFAVRRRKRLPRDHQSDAQEYPPKEDTDTDRSEVFDGSLKMRVHTTIRAVPSREKGSPELPMLEFNKSMGLDE